VRSVGGEGVSPGDHAGCGARGERRAARLGLSWDGTLGRGGRESRRRSYLFRPKAPFSYMPAGWRTTYPDVEVCELDQREPDSACATVSNLLPFTTMNVCSELA
jgi:hypothetical protein